MIMITVIGAGLLIWDMRNRIAGGGLPTVDVLTEQAVEVIDRVPQQDGRRVETDMPLHDLVQIIGSPGDAPAIRPLSVDMPGQQHDRLAGWWRELEMIGFAALCLAAGFLILFRVLGRQFRRLADQNLLLQQTAAALRDSERRGEEKSRLLEATLEHMDQGLIMIDDQRTVAICNRRAIELLDLPPEMMARRPKFEDVLAFQWKQQEFAGSDAEFRSFVQRGLLLDGPRIYERRRPNGRVLEVRSTMLPQGEAVRTYTDVTDRREALDALALAKEQAESANRAKTAFLANISHELRTPLSAIIGFSELIRDQTAGAVDATYVSYAKDILAGGKHLLDLVNDLLDLSKIEAGRYDLIEEPVNLSQILDSCQRMMAPHAESGRVRIVRDPNLDGVVLHIDRRAIQQVLLNLLDNAVKFSPVGGTTVVRAEPMADGGMAVVVSDDGIGIEPTAMQYLFEPFSQADGSISRKFGGTGLGLAISRRLMNLHGGTLEIVSRPAVGTTVRAAFPAARVVRLTPAGSDG
jgi:signal transduction histidine kinase